MTRIILPGLTFLAFFATSCAVRAQDEINDVKTQQEILVQKMTTQVIDAIDRSRKLERTDPVAAKYLLKDVVA